MTSETLAGWVCRMGELLLGLVGGGRLGDCGGCRCRLDALHEGGVLLEEGWEYCGWVGPSCSTHNPWSVDPDPRGVDRLGPARADSGRSRRRTMTTGPRTDGGQGAVQEGLWCRRRAVPPRTLDSLLRGPVSTALT